MSLLTVVARGAIIALLAREHTKEAPMPILAELYVATRTRNTANADTENLPVLVVKRGSDIVFTKPLFGGDFRTAPWRGCRVALRRP